jgi:hypothetical protein
VSSVSGISGSVALFFLFDVGDGIDLSVVRREFGSGVSARLSPKPVTPAYVQYVHPPLALDGLVVQMPEIEGFHVRLKTFDYGVISVALTRPLPDGWDELSEQALSWHDNRNLSTLAERCCRNLVTRLGPAVTTPRASYLTEDYFVIAATSVSGAMSAEALLSRRGGELAQLLRGEREPLSTAEREEVLRHRISYLANDLVIPTWSGAFVYDTEAGAQGAIEILEFANSQLLEFRYYDELLDRELSKAYTNLERSGWRRTLFGGRYARQARQVQAVLIDVNELTAKAENALKLAGDVYAVRLFALAAARLGLDEWKASVREKLKTLDDIYRFAVEHTAMTRGEFLEAVVVIILLVELGLLLAGVMK